MKSRLFIIALCLFFLGGAAISASALNVASEKPAPPVKVEMKRVPDAKVVVRTAGMPTRIRIPSINVNAKIEEVGLTASGAMEDPSGWWTTAWYGNGPRPGEKGNAVIAGHYDSDTGPAVFVHVGKLEPGDEIEIADDRGVTRTFVVRSTEAFDGDDAPMERIFGDTSGTRLNLVTCDGEWDETIGGYSKRLVVFATLEKVTQAAASADE